MMSSKKIFLRDLQMPTFAAVNGSRICGIKMGSPVKIRRYPRSCKEAGKFELLVEQRTTVAQ